MHSWGVAKILTPFPGIFGHFTPQICQAFDWLRAEVEVFTLNFTRDGLAECCFHGVPAGSAAGDTSGSVRRRALPTHQTSILGQTF
jgi:hypothetical protein